MSGPITVIVRAAFRSSESPETAVASYVRSRIKQGSEDEIMRATTTMENTMRAPITDAVTERLDRLERQMRLWREFGTLAGLAAVVLLLMGLAPSGPPIVAAQRFVVVDGNGTAHASFGLAGDGSPLIGFSDKNGITRVTIGVLNGQPEVTLMSSTGKVSWQAPLGDPGPYNSGPWAPGDPLKSPQAR